MHVITYRSSIADMPALYVVADYDWLPIPGHVYSTEQDAETAAQRLSYADSGTHGGQDHSSVGGYPLIAVTHGGDVVCSVCAHQHRQLHIPPAGTVLDRYARADVIESIAPHYEGPPIGCDSCSREIASAYGDPDAEQTDADAA